MLDDGAYFSVCGRHMPSCDGGRKRFLLLRKLLTATHWGYIVQGYISGTIRVRDSHCAQFILLPFAVHILFCQKRVILKRQARWIANNFMPKSTLELYCEQLVLNDGKLNTSVWHPHFCTIATQTHTHTHTLLVFLYLWVELYSL